jgi:predicted metal-dependent enzyme (double-stranded beta helix superfamily)
MEWKSFYYLERANPMSTTTNLDLSRLEKDRNVGGKIIARCPACAESGGDRKGNHLTIFPSGKYACAAMPGDAEHRRRIFSLVGVTGERERDPEQERKWREKRVIERRSAQAGQRLIDTIQAKRDAIISRHVWMPEEVWEDSPQEIDSALVEFDPRHFLASLFAQNAIVWAGEVFHSGNRHTDHWRTVAAWQDTTPEEIGSMTTPAVWKPDTVNRCAYNVRSSPFTVLDFDGFDGRKPETPLELERHRRDSLALIRWIREGLNWRLAAIVWTGSKSMHAWFHTPQPNVLQSLRNNASALGIDPGLIGRPEHPCRLPGQRHEKTGGMSRVLWLEVPEP